MNSSSSIMDDGLAQVFDKVRSAVGSSGISIKVLSIAGRFVLNDRCFLEIRSNCTKCQFEFWHHLYRPTPGNDLVDLYLVPGYHPVMRGSKSIGLVNGDTDAFIRGIAVRSIHSPEDARTRQEGTLFGSTWTHVNHPYCVKGCSFVVEAELASIRGELGISELASIIRAALRLDERFIEISGGFRAPMQCAHNRLLDLNRKSPWSQADYERSTGHVARGSEQHCVWAYRVMREEGELERAYIPSWFFKEGWLEIYEGAPQGVDLY